MSGADDAIRKFVEQQAKQREALQKALRNLVPPPVTLPRLLPPQTKIELPQNRMMADTLYADTKALIQQTESGLKDGQQLLAFYVDRSGGPIVVSDLGYHNPNMMVIWGTDLDGNDCSVIVHMASFEMQLKVVEAQPETPPRQIGFVAPTRVPDEGE